jgi:splicing factor 3B subunit 3
MLQESIALTHTPRGFVRHPTERLFYVIEADSNTLAPATKQTLLNDANLVNGDAVQLPPEEFGHARAKGHWASCIQIVDPVEKKEVLATVFLEENEAAVSVAAVAFSSQDDETFLLVGTGKDMVANPSSATCGYIHVYRFDEGGKELEFIHKTKVDSPPRALMAFQGRVLAGIGRDLRLYDLGMKQLLRKAQKMNCVSNLIVGLQTQGSRIVVSDVQESVTYVVYKFQDNELIPFVDDSVARWTTSTAMVDYETTAGGDKFGNLWLVRCPEKSSEQADEDGSGAHLIHEKGYLGGTPNRLESMVNFYCQDIPTTVQKTALVPGGREILVWGGLQGSIGILVPFVSREDVDFFQSLESQLRMEDPPLAGRDHLIYRGYYVPVKGAIDGDLCERFVMLDNTVREKVAGEVERAPREVERKISVSFFLGLLYHYCLIGGEHELTFSLIGHADSRSVLNDHKQKISKYFRSFTIFCCCH